MGTEEDRRVLEGALYAADHPMTMEELKKILGTSSETYTRKLIDELKSEHGGRGGAFRVVEGERGTFSLKLAEELFDRLDDVIPKMRISRGALKTLAMVAYKQPITQARLAELRGSRTYDHIRQLSDAGFVEWKRYERTRVLRVSKKFASHLGFDSDMDKMRERLEELVR
ncbi:MAG: SMC-Scp complex subunit ScpB [Candidatus Hadarchaeota archaeon]